MVTLRIENGKVSLHCKLFATSVGFWGFFYCRLGLSSIFLPFYLNLIFLINFPSLVSCSIGFLSPNAVAEGVIWDFDREIQLWARSIVVQYPPRKQIRINWCPGSFKSVTLDSAELEASGYCWQGRSGHICRAQIQLRAKELLGL